MHFTYTCVSLAIGLTWATWFAIVNSDGVMANSSADANPLLDLFNVLESLTVEPNVVEELTTALRAVGDADAPNRQSSKSIPKESETKQTKNRRLGTATDAVLQAANGGDLNDIVNVLAGVVLQLERRFPSEYAHIGRKLSERLLCDSGIAPLS